MSRTAALRGRSRPGGVDDPSRRPPLGLHPLSARSDGSAAASRSVRAFLRLADHCIGRADVSIYAEENGYQVTGEPGGVAAGGAVCDHLRRTLHLSVAADAGHELFVRQLDPAWRVGRFGQLRQACRRSPVWTGDREHALFRAADGGARNADRPRNRGCSRTSQRLVACAGPGSIFSALRVAGFDHHLDRMGTDKSEADRWDKSTPGAEMQCQSGTMSPYSCRPCPF